MKNIEIDLTAMNIFDSLRMMVLSSAHNPESMLRCKGASDDALVALRAGAEQGRFDILLVSEFARIGRVPLECSFAAAFFERSGVEVWDTVTGHIGLYVLH